MLYEMEFMSQMKNKQWKMRPNLSKLLQFLRSAIFLPLKLW